VGLSALFVALVAAGLAYRYRHELSYKWQELTDRRAMSRGGSMGLLKDHIMSAGVSVRRRCGLPCCGLP
jgi:hypothetical protein